MTLTENFKKEAEFSIEGYISQLQRTSSKDLLGVKKIGKYEFYNIGSSTLNQLKKYKIRVITLCPDRVATDMQKEFFTLKEFKKHKKNMLQPNDIAKIVIQIVKGKFKTGSVVEV